MNSEISIIIPAYNAGNFIENTLKKLELQSFKDFEVVIINDGSTDNTQLIVENFMSKTTLNIKLINQENKGEGEARNTGLKNANGEYILFLDADDYLANDALEKLYNALIEVDADMSFSSYTQLLQNKKSKNFFNPNKTYSNIELIKYFSRRLVNPGIGNTLIKRETVINNNIFFKKYKSGADNHFFLIILLYVKKVVSISDNLFFYLYNESSVTNSNYTLNNIDSIYAALDAIKQYEIKYPKLIPYLKIFLLNSVKGRALNLINSNNLDKKNLNNILIYLPTNIPFKLFISKKRTLWLLALFVFYKYPNIFLKVYALKKHLIKGSK